MDKKELKKAKKLALERISEIIIMGMIWPDDDWFSLSQTVELNLWTMRKNERSAPICKATLYEVKNGNIITSKWWSIL